MAASTSRACAIFVPPCVPNIIDGDMSTRAHAVSTGSSSGTRTMASTDRAVSGQSIHRTSSPGS